jgi:hypothetical protein
MPNLRIAVDDNLGLTAVITPSSASGPRVYNDSNIGIEV